MFIIAPLLCFILIFLICQRKLNDSSEGFCWRSAILLTAVIWKVMLVAITEGLSVFKLLTFGWILAAWIVIILIAVFIYLRCSPQEKNCLYQNKLSNIPPSTSFLLYSIIFIVTAIGIVAIVAPPNNFDSMVYHMSRVFFWSQNHSLAVYPTHQPQQILYTPGPEYIILHLQILSGGDRFANIVQWFSMIGCLIGVSLIAKILGAKPYGQMLSAFLCAALPMAILQGSSTQTDLVTSFWLICFVYFSILTMYRGILLYRVLAIGASLGAVLLSKGTAYIYVVPFLVWLTIWGIKNLRWKIWKPMLIVSLMIIFLNIGYYARVLSLRGAGSFIGINFMHSFLTRKLAIHVLFLKIIRALSIHIATSIESFNAFIIKGLKSLHEFMKIDISDPSITASIRGFLLSNMQTHEDYAGNPLHLLAILLALFILFFRRQLRSKKILINYLITVSSAFLLFVFLVKWDPYQSRYHLPIFILFCPFIAVALTNVFNYKVINYTSIFFLLFSLPYVFSNAIRPIIAKENIFNTSRSKMYFNNRHPDLFNDYKKASLFLKSNNCHQVGLYNKAREWEYPLLVFLQGNGGVRIESIKVMNRTKTMYNSNNFKDFRPDAIVVLGPSITESFTYKDDIYYKKWTSDSISVFLKD